MRTSLGLAFLLVTNSMVLAMTKSSPSTYPELSPVQMITDDPVLVPFSNYVPYDSTQVLRKDTTVIFVNFELDRVELDESFLDNANALRHIVSSIRRITDDRRYEVSCVQIVGMASIEGSAAYNYNLGMQRAESLKRYLRQHVPTLSDEVFDLNSGGEAWTELRSLVEDSQFDGKAQVLHIIDHTTNLWLRERRIKDLMDGKVYEYMLNHLFVAQRVAGYMRIYYDVVEQPEPEEPQPATEPVSQPEPEPEVQPEPVVEPTPTPTPNIIYEGPWRLAVKTNLLFDAALAPNIEVERWFGKRHRFSLMAEVWFPWYVWRSNSRAFEVLNIGLEGRYWLTHSKNPNRPITGFFLGVYAAGGKYDLEWKSKGNQGEFTSLGLSVGYTWRIGRNFNMEVSAAAGWLSGPYRHYVGMFDDTHLIWQRNEHFSYVGPTKLKFSLVWLWPERRRK
ncbi:MAG: DUF3575 domain-containing protein [Bacteroidaceae bacterium]|nr:DUF3575 domain-containing protein [Bacteroidaceae bacterium]